MTTQKITMRDYEKSAKKALAEDVRLQKENTYADEVYLFAERTLRIVAPESTQKGCAIILAFAAQYAAYLAATTGEESKNIGRIRCDEAVTNLREIMVNTAKSQSTIDQIAQVQKMTDVVFLSTFAAVVGPEK